LISPTGFRERRSRRQGCHAHARAAARYVRRRLGSRQRGHGESRASRG